VTVQGSADAIPAVLIRHNLVRYCPTRGTPDCASSTLIQTLQRFSYAVSFDTGPNRAERRSHSQYLGGWNGGASDFLR
jgi:hypothetical protein